MSWRATVMLAAALALAVLYAWRDPNAGPFAGAERKPPPGQVIKPLLTFDPADIEAIHLKSKDVDLRVQRHGKTWAGVTRPWMLDDFLANLLTLGEIAVLDVPAEERGDYGLGPPQAVIELTGGKAPVTILLGHRNPPGTGAYIQRRRDGPVVLAGSLILWEFEKAVRAIKG